jgi:hypothetical protein
MRRGARLLAVLAAAGCQHGARDPGAASLRSYYYTDNSGVSVKTLAASAAQPVSDRVEIGLRGMGEQIVLRRKPLDVGDPGAMQGTGHPPHEPDAVTSASATAAGGEVAEEYRFEGIGTATITTDVDGQPARARILLRGSTEPDYRSLYGSVGGEAELNDRNTTVAGFAGFGRDRVMPVEAPPGEADDWPATHIRVNGGGTVSQILSERLILSAGLGGTVQNGQLANPYRRAVVVTTLFPEVVPRSRIRFTGFAGLAWYLGAGTALHVRQGAYADTWDVYAWIPEVAVATELAATVLAQLRYRFYLQSSADFYQGRYRDLEPLMSGDARLGRVVGHIPAAEVEWKALGDPAAGFSLGLIASYELSVLDYPDYATNFIIGHVASLGLAGRY